MKANEARKVAINACMYEIMKIHDSIAVEAKKGFTKFLTDHSLGDGTIAQLFDDGYGLEKYTVDGRVRISWESFNTK